MKTMTRYSFLRLGAMALVLTALSPLARAAAYTPPAGSAERKAICDTLREHLLTRLATRKPPQPIVFKVDTLRIDGGYAWFEGVPLLKDGSYAAPDYLPDVGYIFVLRKTVSGWKIQQDLSRSDVPDESELAGIRASLRDVPSSIMPAFWRELLKR